MAPFAQAVQAHQRAVRNGERGTGPACAGEQARAQRIVGQRGYRQRQVIGPRQYLLAPVARVAGVRHFHHQVHVEPAQRFDAVQMQRHRYPRHPLWRTVMHKGNFQATGRVTADAGIHLRADAAKTDQPDAPTCARCAWLHWGTQPEARITGSQKLVPARTSRARSSGAL